MKNYLILLISIICFSCQQKEKNKARVNNSDGITTKKKKEVNKQIGDTIFMNFMDEKGLLIAESLLDSLHPRIYVRFKNKELGILNAKLIPTTGKGNIRFNQIIFPDKTSEGPFGMDLQIDLKQNGNYIIIIGRSLMADNPFYGKFKVQLESKKE
ncbi:hypothetical protein SGQ44_12145 [Flavobacterium sp. Fl-77]|uniref:Uncharacterized protein n=1 Tax=Flavobacterium flavipigmentatum TaxID=2893884 RepID=A0AAJ2SG30_9FLAO|nr:MULTISPECIES: hypothetical protein [unclassified Flavobacterium]MDX6183231.1 hypothetical protein [Flavobacterium sp. Fl-33]MDX6186515.1 hypothetical protein [Flavobacterium sp. Fl-77]UFH38715.1 hypothetical protein LNP22_00155 [Flavobacterium sp. F-70]